MIDNPGTQRHYIVKGQMGNALYMKSAKYSITFISTENYFPAQTKVSYA